MTATHTPGPWTFCDHGKSRDAWVAEHDFTIRDSRNCYVADVRAFDAATYKDGQLAANVRLIAAAPDMLAALRNILREATTDIGGIDRDEALDVISSTADLVRAAIARAEGGAPCPIPPPPLPLAASILAEIEAVRTEIAVCEASEARNPDDEGWEIMATAARERMAGLVRIADAAGVTIPAASGK